MLSFSLISVPFVVAAIFLVALIFLFMAAAILGFNPVLAFLRWLKRLRRPSVDHPVNHLAMEAASSTGESSVVISVLRIAVVLSMLGIFGALDVDALHAQGTGLTGFQFPSTPWNTFAPTSIQCGELLGANMNEASVDQPITILVPSANYMLASITLSNASISLTAAEGGFYSAKSQGGTALVAATQVYSTLTGAALNASGSAMLATISTAGTNNELNLGTIYFNLGTAQGAPATADIRVYCRPLYN